MSDDPTVDDIPSEEELAARFVAQLAKTDVRDIILQSLATLIDSAGVRLGFGPVGDEGRDLTQAKQAIEAASALADVVAQEVGAEEAKVFEEPLRVIKMAYVQATQEAEAPTDQKTSDESPSAPAPEAEQPASNDAASRLWTPPGTRQEG